MPSVSANTPTQHLVPARIIFSFISIIVAGFFVVVPHLSICQIIGACAGTIPAASTPFVVLALAVFVHGTIPESSGFRLMIFFVLYIVATANAAQPLASLLGQVLSGYTTAAGLNGWPLPSLRVVGTIGGIFLAYAFFYTIVKMVPGPLGIFQTFHEALSLSTIVSILDFILGLLGAIAPILNIIPGLIGVIKNAVAQHASNVVARGEDEARKVDEGTTNEGSHTTNQGSLPPPYSIYKADNRY